MGRIFLAVLLAGVFGFAAIALGGTSNKRDVDATAIVTGADCDTTATTTTSVDVYGAIAAARRALALSTPLPPIGI